MTYSIEINLAGEWFKGAREYKTRNEARRVKHQIQTAFVSQHDRHLPTRIVENQEEK